MSDLHIWQLPDKIDNIDKENDLTIIHDGYFTKKLTMNKLYDYFNQDYKVDNIVGYFEDELNKIDDEYNSRYDEIERSTLHYDIIVKELQDKFIINRNDIRELWRLYNNILNTDNETNKQFKIIQDKYNQLYESIRNFERGISIIQSNNITEDIDILEDNVSKLTEDIEVETNILEESKNKFDIFIESEKEILNENKDIFIKNIQSEYDKIISIIDKYHHIHDPKID